MFRFLLFFVLFQAGIHANAKSTLVRNSYELDRANEEAKAGDTILLQNGEWKNITITLTCNGTEQKPIVIRALTSGKVLITGNSKIQIGGSYLIIEGLYFTDGYSGKDAVIKFSVNKNQLANNCRITQCVINDFNNPKRMDENYWVALYGKNNRVDHCSFLGKKNMGVMLAVIMDDERSRESNHSIDHNYFGVRVPLASNTGETIRVGVSEHCEFNSNTVIEDNYFDQCDGETEIISIKSGLNTIRRNLFNECQGAVVLRHGNHNTVENNIFLGNNKRGTGGVRVINQGQWVVNNLFYKLRGEGFRSPLSVMNGVPNSPANRYLSVTDALISNNSFVDCSPISFCEGSDTERSVPPRDVQFLYNVFFNSRDSAAFLTKDDISGIHFAGNVMSKQYKQDERAGFLKVNISSEKVNGLFIPLAPDTFSNIPLYDSLMKAGQKRLSGNLPGRTGFTGKDQYLQMKELIKNDCGAPWWSAVTITLASPVKKVSCKNAVELKQQLEKNKSSKLIIRLTGSSYEFSTPLEITQEVVLESDAKKKISVSLSGPLQDFLIHLKGGGSLVLKELNMDLSRLIVKSFLSTDTSGSSNHSNFSMNHSTIENLSGSFFHASRSSVCDSIVIRASVFRKNKGRLLNFMEETSRRGYYNVEKMVIANNVFEDQQGQILSMLRGGNDESTMGPEVIFSGNQLKRCVSESNLSLIFMHGTQRSVFINNRFEHCNKGGETIQFYDEVRSTHDLNNNRFTESGSVITNKFVLAANNIYR